MTAMTAGDLFHTKFRSEATDLHHVNLYQNTRFGSIVG